MIRSDTYRYAARPIPWQPPLIALALSSVIVIARMGGQAALPMQVTALLLAGAAGFCLDDPAYEVMAPSPHSLLRRRLHRVLVVVPPISAVWLAAWAIVASQGSTNAREFGALLLMFVGLIALSLGIAGITGRRTHGRGGPVVAPTLFVLQIISTALPPQWRYMPLGDLPGGWSAIYSRWAAVAVVGLMLFLLSSRDEAKKSIVHSP